MAGLEREEKLRARLGQFYEPGDIERWFRWKHPALGNRSAADLIADGKIELVEQYLGCIETGGFV